MKKSCIAAIIMSGIIFAAACFPSASFYAAAQKTPSGEEQSDITLLFTSDVHSNLIPRKKSEDGTTSLVGGFARLKTAVDENTDEGNTLILDSGDFSVGTMYQNFSVSDAIELNCMQSVGYDAVALGNHDFDSGEDKLCEELDNFYDGGADMAILCSNLVEKDKKASPEQNDNPLSESGVKNYAIFERAGLKIGVFSLLGENAEKYTTTEALGFDDVTKTAKAMVKKLREDEQADLVILLSHCGLTVDGQYNEDREIASAVDGIDVILSGHTHIKLDEPVYVNDTVIVCAGTALENLGKLGIDKTESGYSYNYELIPINSDIAENAEISSYIAEYTDKINSGYLRKFGATTDIGEVFAETEYNFPGGDQMEFDCEDYNTGALIGDAFLSAARKNGCSDVSIAAVPVGTVRGGLYTGTINTEDAYNMLAHGMSPLDDSSGAPLVNIYVNGRELYDICEASISLYKIIPAAQILFSGLRYSYNPDRLILNKVYKVEVRDGETGEYKEVQRDESTLYSFVCSWTSMQSIALMKSTSFGLLSVEPKDASGRVLSTEEEQLESIIFLNGGKTELKEWIALYSFISGMEKGDKGLSDIDEKYSSQGGFLLSGGGFDNYFKNTSKTGVILYCVIIAVIAAVTVSVVFGIRRHKKKKTR